MYHRFGEDRYPSTNIRLEQFEAQLGYLAENGFQIWPLTQIVDYLEQGKAIPDRTVAITVDDAYLSVYTEAYPRLKERGWPFTVFVNTDPVDKGHNGFMSWDQMREMQADGVVFANHSKSHPYMVRREKGESQAAWLARMRTEIVDCHERLEAELGANQVPKLFAYPYGEYNASLLTILKELGYTAFGQQSGPLSSYAHRQALPRYPINEDYGDLAGFRTKALSLALPVADAHPIDPLIGSNNPPRLEIALDTGEANLKQLACYATGQGAIPVEWIDKKAHRFAVQAPKAFGVGRARYNCTAPHQKGGRYFWHSQLWIIEANSTPAVSSPAD